MGCAVSPSVMGNGSFPNPPPLLVVLKKYCPVKEIFPQFPLKQCPYLRKGLEEQHKPWLKQCALPLWFVPILRFPSRVSLQIWVGAEGLRVTSLRWTGWQVWVPVCCSISAPITRQWVAPAPLKIASCACYDPGNKTFHSNEQIYSSGTLITKSIKLHFPAGLYHML